MSGFYYGDNCPNCGETCQMGYETRPFMHTVIRCEECGLQVDLNGINYMTLDELNEIRIEYNEDNEKELPLLTELPVQNHNLDFYAK